MQRAAAPPGSSPESTADWSHAPAPAVPPHPAAPLAEGQATLEAFASSPTIQHPDAAAQPTTDELAALARVPPAIRRRFHKLQFLGKGGMGTVYRAHDIELARDVAIKFVQGDASARFLREARAQARVDHDNIVKIYDVGVADGQPYITMQLIRGQPFNQARDHMTLTEQVKALRECAVALHEAHRIGLIHRDIKPANILLERQDDGRWKPYVLDFGLARTAGADGDTATGAIAGTLAYMAPEQARGDIRALDRRTDVYALGATLYDILAGHPPFVEAQQWKLLLRIEQETPPTLRAVRPGMPADLDTIVQRCLERDPVRRYDSAKALGDDLQRWLDGDPILARPTSFAYRLGRRIRRHKLVSSLVGALLVGTGVFAGVTLQARAQALREAELARTFGESVKEMQLFMRYAHSLPSHDVARERDVVRGRLAALEATLSETSAPGPLYAAIGQGYLTLQEPAQALAHLRLARESVDSPDLEYALGRALVDLYRAESEKLARILDPDVRAARKAELAATYRDPALVHLRAAADARLEQPEQLAGWIALVEDRQEDALRLAIAAEAAAPWFYETTMLIAEAHWAVARKYKHDADFDHERMMASVRPALDAYRRAAAVARSDPSVHAWACGVYTQVIYAEMTVGADMAASFAEGKAACELAIAADPTWKQARIGYAWLHAAYTSGLVSMRADPPGLLAETLELVDTLVAEYPDDAYAHWLAGVTGVVEHQHLSERGLECEPGLVRAIAGYERSLELDPDFSWSAAELASFRICEAVEAQQHGRDPFPILEEARAGLAHAATIWPGATKFPGMYCHLYGVRAMSSLRYGIDPSADLRDGHEVCARVLARHPNNQWFLSSFIYLAEQAQALKDATGEEPTRTVERVTELIERWPGELAPTHALRLHMLAAKAALARGESPEPALARALDAHAAAFAGSDISLGQWYLAEIRLLQIRWGAPRGDVDPSYFEEALAFYRGDERLERMNLELKIPLATVHERRAAWRIVRGEDPTADIREGLAVLATVLERVPDQPHALAVQGTLQLLTARTAPRLAAQQDAARRAALSLSRALERNKYLRREYEPYLHASEQLADARASAEP